MGKNDDNEALGVSKKRGRSVQPDITENSPIMFKKARTKSAEEKSWDVLKNRIYSSIKEGKEAALYKDLELCRIDAEKLTVFFNHRGYEMLDLALNLWGNDKLLFFIVDKIPSECVISVLKRNNFTILKDFFRQGQEFSVYHTAEEKKFRVVELAFLLMIDDACIIKDFWMLIKVSLICLKHKQNIRLHVITLSIFVIRCRLSLIEFVTTQPLF
ncbi:MAG: hypothetical protein KAT71_06490, partial [Gammaproteobacteria bacterium]|nr:hypothetical protein [Gammaproteobacteria bacterium]